MIGGGENLPQGVAATWVRRLRDNVNQGDLGFIPVLVALLLIVIVFYVANPVFLTPRNLSNLTLQVGVLGVMALGVSLVLFLGEIDLSAGSVSGLCAVVMVLLAERAGAPGLLAIAGAIALGGAIGWFQGSWVTLIGAPSFIVTLTGLLVWEGVQRILIGNQIGQLLINDPLVTGIASTFLPSWVSLLFLAMITVWAAIYWIRSNASRSGSVSERITGLAKAALYPLVGLAIFAILSAHRGVPVLLILLAVLTLVLTLITEFTPFGTHIFAVGGNAESARRAGININRVRLIIFAVCSGFAALSGIIAVSRQFAVDANTGGGSLVLDAIAAAVIGGTSLFGGRGRVLGGLLGALVIGSVANGLDLLGQSANVKSIITGAILLTAVSVDMVARRRRISSGAAGA